LIGPGFPVGSYLAGSEGEPFFATVARANSAKLAGGYEASIEAKAALEAMGSIWADPDAESKATVGDTDAACGYLVPNAVVADISLQATPRRSVTDLFHKISGVRGAAVDVPFEQETVSRAVIALPGATKENSNFIVNNYTATLYTLARIFDVGNQSLRQSQGAAEQLVRSKWPAPSRWARITTR
jgi:HK97 family phage major capsid protein